MNLKSIRPSARLAGAALLLGTLCAAAICGCEIVDGDGMEMAVFPAVPAEAKSVLVEQTAETVRAFDGGVSVLDFGKDAYCHLVLTLKAEQEGRLEVLVGEVLKPNAITLDISAMPDGITALLKNIDECPGAENTKLIAID